MLIYWVKTYKRCISHMYWFIYNGSITFLCFLHVIVLFMEFYYIVLFILFIYMICFFVKLVFNFICSWFVVLYFTSSHFSITYQLYGFIHGKFLYFNMPADINTWRTLVRLFVNTTQQSAVFHLTKCRNSALHSILLFLLLLVIFKGFLNSKDSILGFFFCLWPNAFFIQTKISI